MQEEQIEATEANIVTLIKENTDLTSEIHTLTTPGRQERRPQR
jgi:cell division protein FtsB